MRHVMLSFGTGETQSRINWAPGWQKWHPRSRGRMRAIYRTCGVRIDWELDDYTGYAVLWTEWQ